MSYNKERYRTLKNIAYYILFGVWYMVSLLPMWFLHGISSIISVFLFHVIRYRRKVVHENIKSSFPELSPRKRWMIERRFYTHFCDLIMESVKYFSISKWNIKRRMRFKGIERVEESVRKGRSCGVLLGHYGNWEWVSSMPLWIDPKLCLCTQLYHPLENYVTDQLILYTRRRFGGVNIQMDKSIKYMVNYRNEGKPILVGFDRKIKVTQAFLDELKAADITQRDFTRLADDILILHGTKDEVVPFDSSKAFAEKNSIRFIPVENADHRFKNPLTMDAAIKEIEEFFGI